MQRASSSTLFPVRWTQHCGRALCGKGPAHCMGGSVVPLSVSKSRVGGEVLESTTDLLSRNQLSHVPLCPTLAFANPQVRTTSSHDRKWVSETGRTNWDGYFSPPLDGFVSSCFCLTHLYCLRFSSSENSCSIFLSSTAHTYYISISQAQQNHTLLSTTRVHFSETCVRLKIVTLVKLSLQ